jgi:hypothetical protein
MKCERCKERYKKKYIKKEDIKEAVGIINRKHYCDSCCWKIKKDLKKKRKNE